jgi:hypothetical protein
MMRKIGADIVAATIEHVRILSENESKNGRPSNSNRRII